ncbi:Zeta-crystallin [Drechslerella dactyloides]|uniref:Zeta-crystallin n=1 Tax=Drechslerella dactyloides TaxID=74499 RepID=A0AAD6IRY2_DREDA|nr:Zeta-crystallin [Drechslerella dactyloides]
MSLSKMKEYRVITNQKGEIVGEFADVEKPTPKADEVLVKVHSIGLNPKDWKYIGDGTRALNNGDDVAGTIDSVGANVLDLKPGDRVAAFHVIGQPYGAFAEYAIAPASTTFHIPASTSFEDAATMPLVTLTAGIAMYQELGLPTPWSRMADPSTPFDRRNPIPFVVYGGTTSVGLTALKLSRLSGLYPIITIAGGSKDIIEKENLADFIIDYRNTPDIAGAIRTALAGKPLLHALDAFAESPSGEPLAEVLEAEGRLTGVLSYKEELPKGHKMKFTYVGTGHKIYPHTPKEDALADMEFAYVFMRYLTRLLVEGRFKTHPVEILPGGLSGITVGLNKLREGTVKATKLVARVAETEGLNA